MKNKKAVIALGAFILVIVAGIIISMVISSSSDSDGSKAAEAAKKKATLVVGAVGGGKENFLADEDVNRILLEKYNIVFEPQHWSNGKLVSQPLTYDKNGVETNYDLAFFSDERFYEYYKQPAAEGEAPRLSQKGGAVALSTPIVFYSWKEVAEAFISEEIVTQRDGVYYISNMPKLLEYINSGKAWGDIGLADTYGAVNIASTDPVTSSPGATYYGLLASVMQRGHVDLNNIDEAMGPLSEFYKYSGFLNNTPADLFDLYLRMGRGAYPIIVDYEKSMLDFAGANPEGFAQVKDRIAILYSQPTIWNSHCLIAFSEGGAKFMEALNDKEIQNIAWERYGFRTGVVGGDYDVESIPVAGIPQEILSVVPGLKKEVYDIMIDGLKTGAYLVEKQELPVVDNTDAETTAD